MTPEQMAEIINTKGTAYFLSTYTTSASAVMRVKPDSIRLDAQSKEWIVEFNNGGSAHELTRFYATEHEALEADAERLLLLADSLRSIVDTIRHKAHKSKMKTLGLHS